MVWLGAIILFSLAVAATINLALLRRPRRGFLSRMRNFQRAFVGDSATAFVRSIIPLSMLAIWVGAIGPLVSFAISSSANGTEGSSAALALLLAFPVVLLLVSVLFLVVRVVGRPRWAIPRAFRGKSEAELEAWLRDDTQ
jgi:hypothetical protein